MGIFDKSNYIVNTGIIEQFFQCTIKMILLAKMIKLWTFYENVVHETGNSDQMRTIFNDKIIALIKTILPRCQLIFGYTAMHNVLYYQIAFKNGISFLRTNNVGP